MRVVAGARSALFLPFGELGLIVVDEEHDPAYKQEDRVFYNARDMAVVRGHIGGFPVVLASATPSVESRVNAEPGRYAHVVLPARFADAALPDLAPIDMRRDAAGARRLPVAACCSPHAATTLERGEQSLLFLNRRGYAPLTLCRACGHRFGCPNCSAWLVEHRFRGQLVCHHCGHRRAPARGLPGMRHARPSGRLRPGRRAHRRGGGRRFPDARTIVLSSDMLGGVRRLRLELEAIAKRRGRHRHRHAAGRQGPQLSRT